MISLGDIAETVMGQAPPGKDCNKEGKGTTFVKAGEFDERFPLIREWTTKPLKFAKTSDVLVCVVGATAGKVNQGIDCAIGRSVAAVRPRNGTLDTGYLYHFLSQQTESLRAKSQGLAQGVITREMLHELQIPVPPPDEQKRIAAILDQAEELLRLRQRTIDRLNDLGPAIFHEMFGEWDRPGSNTPLVKLGSVLEFLTSGSRGWAEHYRDVGSLFLRVQNVRRDQLDLSDAAYVEAPDTAEAARTRVQPGDVLLSITADLGRTAVVPDELGEAFINQHLSILRTTYFEPRFLSAALASPAGQRIVQRRTGKV
jgi:type I restriction enzyme S subunit